MYGFRQIVFILFLLPQTVTAFAASKESFVEYLSKKTGRPAYDVASGICDRNITLSDPNDVQRANTYGEVIAACLTRQNMNHDREQRSLVSVAGQPTRLDVMSLQAQSSVKYFGGSVLERYAQVMPSPFGGNMYRIYREIDFVSCSKANAVLYRCSYNLLQTQYAEKGSSYGEIVVAFMNATSKGATRVQDELIRKGGIWTSPTLDAKNARIKAERATINPAQSTNEYGENWREQMDRETRDKS